MADPLAASWSKKDRRSENTFALGASLGDKIWGLDTTASTKFHLKHYNALCADPDASKLAFSTHQDVVDLVNLVKSGTDRTLLDLTADIGGTTRAWLPDASDATVRRAIKFAVSLWLMFDIESWKDDVSLYDFVHGLFPDPGLPVTPVEGNITFNARSLWVIGGLDLIYTSRLKEHLRFNKETSELYVFRHASFLGGRIDTGQKYVKISAILSARTDAHDKQSVIRWASHRNRRDNSFADSTGPKKAQKLVSPNEEKGRH